MKTKPTLLIAVFLALSTLQCTHKTTAPGGRETRTVAAAPVLPGNEAWTELENFTANLDLTAPGTELGLSTGGTSIYAIVRRGGRPIGAVLPENTATRLSGEVLSFRLAQLFGVVDIYQPGFYLFLEGKNLEAFQKIIPRKAFVGEALANKELNRKRVLESIRKNPQGIDAIYKDWSFKPVDYDALVNPSANKLNGKHVLKGSKTPLAQFLTCKGPQPSKTLVVTLNGGTTTEYEAARELAAIFVIDALVQQWDRFSGGNLQTLQKGDRAHFASYDNGGAWGGIAWSEKYTEIVSRFEEPLAQTLLEMNRFLNEGAPNFREFRTEEELKQALGIARLPSHFPKFKAALKVMAAHIQKHQGCYFLL